MHDDLKGREHGQSRDKGMEPARGPPRQQPVIEDAGHDRVDDAEEIGNHAGQHDKGHGASRALQTLFREGDGAPAPAGGLEFRPQLKGHHDAGERLVKLLHRHGHHAAGRVVQHGLARLEAVQHHEVIEVPVDDAREGGVLLQVLHFQPVAVRLQAVVLCGNEHVFHVGAVAGDAAVQAHLLQRHPLLIIGQDHRETGRAALQRFHLHDHRHPCHAALDGLLQLPLSHACTPSIPQKADGRGGFQHQLGVVFAVRQGDVRIVRRDVAGHRAVRLHADPADLALFPAHAHLHADFHLAHHGVRKLGVHSRELISLPVRGLFLRNSILVQLYLDGRGVLHRGGGGIDDKAHQQRRDGPKQHPKPGAGDTHIVVQILRRCDALHALSSEKAVFHR